MTQEQVTSLEDMDTEMTPEQEAEFRREVFNQNSPAEEPGETVVVDADEEEVDPEAGTVVAPDPKPEVDPWEGVAPGLKTLFEGMSKKLEVVDTIAGRLKQAENRIGSFEPTIVDMRNAKKAAVDAPTEAQIAAAAKSKVKLDELIDQFPEYGEVLKEQLEIIRSEVDAKLAGNPALQTEIDELKAKVKSGASTQLDFMNFFRPDWEAVAGSKEYRDYVETLSGADRAKHTSPLASDALDLLEGFDAYKSGTPQKSAAQIAEERRTRLKASVLPKKEPSQAPKSEEHMTEQEFRKSAAAEIWPKKK